MIVVFTFVVSLCLGSFATCLLHRLHFDEKGIASGRSHCPACHVKLTARELIPVFSWLIQKGQCRHCRAKISFWYPLIEIGFAVTLTFFALIFQKSFDLYWILISVFFLLLLFFQDVRYLEVDRRIAWPAIFIALAWSFFREGSSSFWIGGVIGLSFYAVQYFCSRKKWVGAGDMDLGLLMGLLLGWPQILVGLFFAYVLGLFWTLPLLVLKKLTLKSAVPMGGFLIPATLVMLLWGEGILEIYWSMIGI